MPCGMRNKLQTFKRSKEREERAREADKAKLSAKAKVQAFLTRMKENDHDAMLAGPQQNPVGPRNSTEHDQISTWNNVKCSSLMESGCTGEFNAQRKRMRGGNDSEDAEESTPFFLLLNILVKLNILGKTRFTPANLLPEN